METREQIAANFGKYMHPFWGVVGMYPAMGEDKATFTCDNYHLFTALYFRMFAPLTLDIDCYCQFLGACMVKSGLYARFPKRLTDISQDEIYGMCSISSVGLPEAERLSAIILRTAQVPAEIETYGHTNWWSYNLTTPGKFTLDTFLGRFPCFTHYLQSCSSSFTLGSPFWSAYWFFGFILSAFTNQSETSGKLLSYVQIPIMKKTFLGRVAISFWQWKMKRSYPGGIKQVCGVYFPAGHPFTIHAPEDFA